MFDEQIDEIRKDVPTFSFSFPQPHPCCTYCKYLSDTQNMKDYADDDHHGVEKCKKHDSISFGYSSQRIPMLNSRVCKCDDFKFKSHIKGAE